MSRKQHSTAGCCLAAAKVEEGDSEAQAHCFIAGFHPPGRK
jgi:hypothetical protein